MGQIQINGGRRWAEDRFAPNTFLTYELPDEPTDICLQLGEEDLILPGLSDMHTHLWAPPAVSSFGIAEEKYYATGFVGALDAGTYGVDGWEAADRFWRNAGHMHIKSFLSVLPEGLTIFPPKTPTMPEAIDVDRYVQMIRGNKGRALGVKVQLGWLPYKSVTTDTQLLDICRAIADGSDSHMMVHISGQCMDPRASMNAMQTGDIITHPYSGFTHTILDERGRVYREVFEAQERGVLFDVGYAGKHFSWKVFKAAWEQGVGFDTLGSDMATMTYRTENSIVIDQFHILSALLNCGVDENTVFRALTVNPAKYLEYTPDMAKHCVVLKKHAVDTVAIDGQGDSIPMHFAYAPAAVIHEGKLLHI